MADTAVSLHTLGGGGVVKTQSTKFWPNFHLGGGILE